MTPSQGVIVVFAKAPRAGLVKTRMTPPFSPEAASELYAHLLDDVLHATAEFSRVLSLEPIVAVYPPDARAEIAACAPKDFRIIAQRGRDLGERMSWAMREAAAAGARRILLRGSDSPVLSGDVVTAVLDRLATADVAICPDLDGGYSLIGVRRPSPGLFDHPMSTGTVLEDTLANAKALGLRSEVLPPSFDLDTAEDLKELVAARERGDTTLCPRLLAYLDAGDCWDLRG